MRLRVKVKHPLWDMRDRYVHGTIPEFNEYEGDVMPNPSWLDSNSFCLTTGDRDAPFRIIVKNSIVSGSTCVSNGADPVRSYVSIPGNSGKRHNVYLSDDGLQFSCDCIGYGYRRNCSHVQEVLNAA
jgi:hypothetical protein